MTTNRDSDRDLLVRVDADVKHLSKVTESVSNRQEEQQRNIQTLSDNMAQLTFNVGALVEGMKDAKEAMHTIGKHEQRLSSIETWQAAHLGAQKEAQDAVYDELRAIRTEMKDDRQSWSPAVRVFGHWKWLLGGVLAFVALVGGPVIIKIVQAIMLVL